MITISCPKCRTDVTIDISKAVDSLGEVYSCPNCGFHFRYTEK